MAIEFIKIRWLKAYSILSHFISLHQTHIHLMILPFNQPALAFRVYKELRQK